MVRAVIVVLALWFAVAACPAAAGTGLEGSAPDTLAGVLALLDRDRPDPQRVAHLREVLATPVTPTDQTGQVTLLWEQGKAALGLGLTGRSLEDLKEAARLAPGHLEPDRLPGLYLDIAIAEGVAAHPKAGAAAWQAAIQAQEDVHQQRGRLFASLSGAVNALTATGDTATAKLFLERLHDLLKESRSWQKGTAFAGNGERWQALVDRAEGCYLLATGAWPEATAAFRRGLDHIDASASAVAEDDPEQTSGPAAIRIKLLAGLAQALVQQGQLGEGETVALKALAEQVRRFGRETPQTAMALEQVAMVALARGRFDDAERLIRLTNDLYDRLGHGPESRARNRGRNTLAMLQVLTGRLAEAERTYATLVRDMIGDPTMTIGVLGRDLCYPYLLIRRGRAAEALPFLGPVLETRRRLFGESHPNYARALGVAALAQASLGQRAAALAGFREAAQALIAEAPAVDSDSDSVPALQELFRRVILEGAVTALVDAGQGDEAFRLAEAARGHRVQQAIAEAAARVAAGSPELATLVRGEQDAAFTLAALRSQLSVQLVQPATDQDRTLMGRLESDIARAEGERTRRRSAITRDFPSYAGLINPRPAGTAEVLAVLKPDEAMVAVLVGEDRSWVWCLRPGRPVAVAPIAMGERALGAIVSQVRKSLDLSGAGIPVFDLTDAARLYAAILAPVAGNWQGTGTLLVVPDRALAALPFALLPTAPPAAGARPDYRRVPWLIRQTSITHLPSATILVALRHLSTAAAGRKPFLGFADPVFNRNQLGHNRLRDGADTRGPGQARGLSVRAQPSRSLVRLSDLSQVLPPLPETADEVRGVAQALGADPVRDVMLGADVTVARVRAMPLSDRRVLMFATHGLMAGEVADVPQPALALSVPAVLGQSGPALLTLGDILGLRLDADLVVLSACNTAAPENGETENAEAVSGLGRAFFQAGSRAMLVTHWAVETQSAAALTTGMFRRLATGLPRSEALRQAMIAVLDQPDTPFGPYGYAHPGFWAPYALIGDGGGR
jgi:CHAT domain-containing protein/tetratricopeptide (TPR) repeat protein